MIKIETTIPKQGLNRIKRNERLFLLSVWIFPALLFLVLYIYVNINFLLLAFKQYDMGLYIWYGFGNFKAFAKDVFSSPMLQYAFRNSGTVTLVSYFITLPIGIIVSFFLYKKIFLAEYFKIVFFLPHIISSIVWVLLHKYMLEYGIPKIVGALGGDPGINFLGDPNTAYWTFLVMMVWNSVGTLNLVMLGMMSRIPESLIESGKIDGMKMFHELWYITLPLIFPLIIISLMGFVSALFLSDLGIHAYYGENADFRLYSFNYYLFTRTVGSYGGPNKYPYAAAGGILFTLVVAPCTILIRHFLEKHGPTAEY